MQGASLWPAKDAVETPAQLRLVPVLVLKARGFLPGRAGQLCPTISGAVEQGWVLWVFGLYALLT